MHLANNTLLQGGKYRIVRFISSGGFGCTYEAEHVMLHKKVAIKEFFVKDFCNRDETTSQVSVGITSKTALVDKLKGKFIEEAQSLCTLDHSNIVHVSDVFEENGTAYYVMDYIKGPSLNDLVKRDGSMDEQRAVGYIKQIAEALEYVHSRNRLHLDIKPGNIMVDENDKAVLIDFGASKQYDEEGGENTSTLLGKTPGYAPLEQMGNDVVKFLPSTDIYALGATLYKLLTGVTPPSASLLASGEELGDMPSTISASTRNAIIAAMQTNKMKRPQSVKDFLKLLLSDVSTSSSADEEDDHTIVDEKPVKPVQKPKVQKENKPKQQKEVHSSNEVEPEQPTNDVNKTAVLGALPKEKFGFWLWAFLVVICASAVASFLNPIITFDSYGSETIAIGDAIIGVMLCILSFITLIAFIKRKPDAVFLGKLCIVIPFAFSLITMLTASYDESGLGSMQSVVKSLVNGIIWFVYLCVSKRVEAVIPSYCRKILKRDYIICAAFAILVIYIFAFVQSSSENEIGPSFDTVQNEVYYHKGSPITYTGEVKDSIPHGKGVGNYPHGKYEGEYVEGNRHGEGMFVDAEGGVFTGTFENDDYSKGKYVQKDGTYYEGTFKNQQPYNGTWYEKNGAVIVNVVNGIESGKVVQQAPSPKKESGKKSQKSNVKQAEEEPQNESNFVVTGTEWYY